MQGRKGWGYTGGNAPGSQGYGGLVHGREGSMGPGEPPGVNQQLVVSKKATLQVP